MHPSAPRPYSTLRDGKIVWVTPEEHANPQKARSRTETDAEVRARLKAAGHWHCPNLSGKKLDAQLDYWGMSPRKSVDEPQ